MPDEFDPFAPGSNLKENFDGVLSCVFEKSSNSDNYNAHMYIKADDGEEVETFLSLGKDWVSYDGGKSVEHPRGVSMKFNNQTTYSEWIVFAMGGFDGNVGDKTAKAAGLEKGLGAAEVMRERNRALGNRGPQVAEIWEGLRFHFDVLTRPSRKRQETVLPDGGVKVDWVDDTAERMMPVRFLGTQGTTKGTQGTAGTSVQESVREGAGSAPTAPKSPGGTDIRTGGGTAGAPVSGTHPALANLAMEDQDALRALAKGRDFGGFVDEAMTLNTSNGGSMLNEPAVIQALSDEQFYIALRNG